MSDPQKLFSAYFDDQLSDRQFAELVAWIREDTANMAQFVQASCLHSSLRDALQGDDIRGLLQDAPNDASRVELGVNTENILSMLEETEEVEQRKATEQARVESLAVEKFLAFQRKQERQRRLEPVAVPQNALYATVVSVAAALIFFVLWMLPDPVPVPTVVASIHDSIDASWSDPSISAAPGTQLFSLENLVLTRGVVEIKFEGGARAIVEAPATLELLSPDSARLEWGKLVGRVPRSEVELTIKTPRASITDLGTEFGVEVNRQQVTHLHVFEGRVSAATFDAKGKPAQQQTVLVDETVYLQPKTGAIETAPAVASDRFARRVPNPLPIYSTGVGLALGDADPNWQIVASKNDPDFVPQQAIVTTPFRGNVPQQEKFLSLKAQVTLHPPLAQHTFRTTFDLEESETRLNRIEGEFRVDNLITAIRVNGTSISFPKHGFLSFKKEPTPFVIDGSLLEVGQNILELDVRVAGKRDGQEDVKSHMALWVRWKGGS